MLFSCFASKEKTIVSYLNGFQLNGSLWRLNCRFWHFPLTDFVFSPDKEIANISAYNGFLLSGGAWLMAGGNWRFALLNEITTLINYSRLTDKIAHRKNLI